MEKCKIKIKKINPTPKSIIHKNPTKIPPFFKRSKRPKKSKYKPDKYHKEKMLIAVLK